MTLDHFVMVRIHARQPSSTIADLRAICELQKLNAKTAVIWLLSGFEVLLTLPSSICADNGAHLKLLSSSLNSQSPLESTPTGRSPSPRLGGGRTRKTFKDRAEAKEYFDFMESQLADFGTSVSPISDRLRVEATQAQRLLEPYGVPLLTSAQHYAACQASAASQKNPAQRGR
jgi:hypothetical protein